MTTPDGGPKAVNKKNMGKLYAELSTRFEETGLDVPFDNAGAFWRHANKIDKVCMRQIETAAHVSMLAFSAISYGLNKRANLGLVSLAGQVCFAHCIGLMSFKQAVSSRSLNYHTRMNRRGPQWLMCQPAHSRQSAWSGTSTQSMTIWNMQAGKS